MELSGPTGSFSSVSVLRWVVMAVDDCIRIASKELSDGVALRVETGTVGTVIVRVGDEVFALEDRCSHQDVRLSEGEVDSANRTIECWKHGSVFSLLDGLPANPPATQPVPTYPVSVDGGEVVVELGSSRRSTMD